MTQKEALALSLAPLRFSLVFRAKQLGNPGTLDVIAKRIKALAWEDWHEGLRLPTKPGTGISESAHGLKPGTKVSSVSWSKLGDGTWLYGLRLHYRDADSESFWVFLSTDSADSTTHVAERVSWVRRRGKPAPGTRIAAYRARIEVPRRIDLLSPEDLRTALTEAEVPAGTRLAGKDLPS